uniref:Uncharacterized protein n=1 Tax=Sphaerodactylus townsendi TaxID=933632 RepID=A0ACB8G3D5_9SAUR
MTPAQRGPPGTVSPVVPGSSLWAGATLINFWPMGHSASVSTVDLLAAGVAAAAASLIFGLSIGLFPAPVTDTVLHPASSSNPVYRSNQTLGGRCEEKQSTDSGAYSIGL